MKLSPNLESDGMRIYKVEIASKNEKRTFLPMRGRSLSITSTRNKCHDNCEIVFRSGQLAIIVVFDSMTKYLLPRGLKRGKLNTVASIHALNETFLFCRKMCHAESNLAILTRTRVLQFACQKVKWCRSNPCAVVALEQQFHLFFLKHFIKSYCIRSFSCTSKFLQGPF